MRWIRNRKRDDDVLLDGEVVVKSVRAHLWRSWEAVGGRLRVTNQRLLFDPQSLNYHRAPLVIALADVKSVELAKSLRVVPNAVVVHTAAGESFKFSVGGRRKLIALIDEQCQLPSADADP